MGHAWRVVVFLVVMALCSAGCELAIEEADAPESTPLPLPVPEAAPAAAPVPGPAAVGVERNVAPLDEPANAESAPGPELVGVTAKRVRPFALQGATVNAAFEARLVVDDDRRVDRVVWRIGGVTFRDDDLRAPYTLRYGSQSFPLDRTVRSDQGLPGRFRAARGSTVELTATVYSNGGREDVSAVFGIGVDATGVSVSTTTVPATTTTAGPPATTTTAGPPATTTTVRPPGPSGDVPWSIAPGADVAVTLPQGRLGPRTATPVDPASVSGISYAGGAWSMARDWDETRDGGYLDFGAAAVRTNGHRVLGFRLEVPPNVPGDQLIDGGGEVGWFEVSNPGRYSHNSFIRHTMHAHHYIARGVVGDAVKVGEGSSAYHHDAYIEMSVIAGGSTDKHYDGVQVFKNGSLRLERVVIEWHDAGVIANTTGALFTQDAATLFARDLLVLNPGGTWQPVRLSGTGAHDVDRVQLIGQRRPNNNSPGKLAPTAAVKLTNGSGIFQLWNGVSGAADWLIE